MNRPEADLCGASAARCWPLTFGGVIVAGLWPLTLVGWLWPESDLWSWWDDRGQTLTSVEWLLPDVDLCELFAARCWSLNSMGWLWLDADLWPWSGDCDRMLTSDLVGVFSPGEIYRSDFLKNPNHSPWSSLQVQTPCASPLTLSPVKPRRWSGLCTVVVLTVEIAQLAGVGDKGIYTFSFSPFSLS